MSLNRNGTVVVRAAVTINRKNKVRILLLSQWFDPEPGATKGLPLALWFKQQGHSVEVLTGFPNYPGGRIYDGYRISFFSRETMSGVAVLRVPLVPSHNKSALGRVANYLSFALTASSIGLALIRAVDVAYVYHPPPTVGLAALAIKFFRRVPFVYHIADMWPETVLDSGMVSKGWQKSVAKAVINSWCNLIYRHAAAITVLSPGFKKLLVERGVPENKVHVIYNWTDEVAFRPVDRDENLARELGFTGRFNVVYAGNLGPIQGLETVILAAALLASHPKIQIIIAGTGHEEARLRRLAEDLGASNVIFLSRRQYWEMPGINALADVLLVHLRDLPFLSSTIPGKTQVALASGRPTLMAVRGDAAELIERSGAGVVCEPENPAAMAAAILGLSRLTEQERDRLGRNGVEYYHREISLSVGAARTEAILRSVRLR